MLFNDKELSLTHEENGKCIHWYVGTMRNKGFTPKEQQFAGMMLNEYFMAMPVFKDILEGKAKPKCETCKGTGKSVLFIAGSNPQCNACGGTGIKTLEIKQDGAN